MVDAANYATFGSRHCFAYICFELEIPFLWFRDCVCSVWFDGCRQVIAKVTIENKNISLSNNRTMYTKHFTPR
ncbi:hypothetical protein VNO80_25457 [Phaseolus coccineus]|uniref:Uncharacterized protein n=1 Tax=Phaseolus coccineus TaxID=3886 RepID=A0AAN9LZ89_PHACN